MMTDNAAGAKGGREGTKRQEEWDRGACENISEARLCCSDLLLSPRLLELCQCLHSVHMGRVAAGQWRSWSSSFPMQARH